MPLTKQTFMEWLRTQPADRRFVYFEGHPKDPTGCAICNFFKDTGTRFTFVGGMNWKNHLGENLPIPAWFLALEDDRGHYPVTVGEFLSKLQDQ